MCDRCAELELENRVLRAERDMLLDQRHATQEWMAGMIHGSPIDPANQAIDPNIVLADRLVEQYPNEKIQAIKELRTQSQTPGAMGGGLGLKEAKNYIDAAYARHADLLKGVSLNGPRGPAYTTITSSYTTMPR